MKKIYILPLLIALFMAIPSQAQRAKVSTIFIYGVGINFADSTCYLTSVQRVENVPLERSQGFLLNRYAYSEQLFQYLYTQAEKRHETCSVFFASTRAKAEKQFLKLKRRMIKERGEQHLIEIPADAFHFVAVPYVERPTQ